MRSLRLAYQRRNHSSWLSCLIVDGFFQFQERTEERTEGFVSWIRRDVIPEPTLSFRGSVGVSFSVPCVFLYQKEVPRPRELHLTRFFPGSLESFQVFEGFEETKLSRFMPSSKTPPQLSFSKINLCFDWSLSALIIISHWTLEYIYLLFIITNFLIR